MAQCGVAVFTLHLMYWSSASQRDLTDVNRKGATLSHPESETFHELGLIESGEFALNFIVHLIHFQLLMRTRIYYHVNINTV